MSSANATVDQEKFGGQMSNGELLFCNQLRELLHGTREGRIPFFAAMADIVSDIHEIWNARHEVDDAKYSGWRVVCANKKRADDVEPLSRPSELEIAFLDDMDGLIDYAMRNGIDFLRVVGAIGHDVEMHPAT